MHTQEHTVSRHNRKRNENSEFKSNHKKGAIIFAANGSQKNENALSWRGNFKNVSKIHRNSLLHTAPLELRAAAGGGEGKVEGGG